MSGVARCRRARRRAARRSGRRREQLVEVLGDQQDPGAGGPPLEQQLLLAGVVAMSRPAARVGERRRAGASPRAPCVSMTRWMLPPESVATCRSAAAICSSATLVELARSGVRTARQSMPRPAPAPARAPVACRERDVLDDGQAGHDRVGDRVLRARRRRRRAAPASGSARRSSVPPTATVPGVQCARAGERVDELALAVAGDAGDADELAAGDGRGRRRAAGPARRRRRTRQAAQLERGARASVAARARRAAAARCGRPSPRSARRRRVVRAARRRR